MSDLSARRVAFSRHPFAASLAPLLLIFLVLFPKGGIKLGDAPLTWGYALLGLTAPPLLLVRLLVKPLRATAGSVAALASLAPFQILYLYSLLANGVYSAAFALSVFTSYFVLPLVFLFIYPAFLGDVDGRLFATLFRNCIFYAAAFGIFLFFFHPLAGFYIEVPYLTVNAADYGQLELTKHIARGEYLKLISTYNNGNLYGVATLILLPLYRVFEPRRWRRNALTLALVLTLSRTVWAGLIFEQLLSFAVVLARSVPQFPRVYLGAALKRGGVIAAIVVGVMLSLTFNSTSIAFLFDSTLGGRVTPLTSLQRGTFLPTIPISVFTEILYGSAIDVYGYAGLLAVLLIFLGPIFLYLANPGMIQSPPRRAAFKGLVLYTLVAISDGANSLIPVMAFYWFVYLVFLCGFPGRPEEWSRALANAPQPAPAPEALPGGPQPWPA